MLIKILLIISVILNAILIYNRIAIKRGINYITTALTEIRKLDFSRRINVGLKYKALGNMSAELNILMDKFQDVLDEKNRLELSHKQLITNISHDIRTPLTSLLGYVEALQKSENITLNERKDYLDIIQSKGQVLYKMIQEFFELSKLEAEDTVIKLQKTDVISIIKEVIASFYEEFVINGITPEIQLPKEAVFVWGEELSIQRIIQNLISNSLRYGSDGGKIGISLKEDMDKVWVEVWDNGKGIPEKDIQFLFDRLYTAEISRNGKMHGNGLGLAITKQLTIKQKGEIFVSSIPGEKTAFYFYLLKF